MRRAAPCSSDASEMGELPDDWALPTITPVNEAWFTAGALAVQCCSVCSTLQHPPEEVCHRCGAMNFTTKIVSPRGTIVSHTVVHYPAHPALADAVPYTVVIVSPDDAPHV